MSTVDSYTEAWGLLVEVRAGVETIEEKASMMIETWVFAL